jgi:hypothetical protein
MALRLTGPQLLQLRQLLRTAFAPEGFADLVTALDRRVDDYAGPSDNYPTTIRKVLDVANAQLWWRDLLLQARTAMPGDPELLAFAQHFGDAPRVVTATGEPLAPVAGAGLEVKIRETGSTFDIGPWLRRVAEISARVCRIEYPEQHGQATGFLVGPDLVLTNYHAVKPIIAQPELAGTVTLRFGYKVADSGVVVEPGVVYGLADPGWLAHASKPADHEDRGLPGADDPDPSELDFAFLHVAGSPGDDPIAASSSDPQPARRGWIEGPIQDYDFTHNPSLAIVQHPDGKPMQIALDTQAVLGMNGNGTRVRYATTTEPGSSGSPCFGPDWQWVALHHMGDPKYLRGAKPEFNQGIPVAAIRALLASEGKLALLGGAHVDTKEGLAP